jgi:AraC-like DNA-binding protein
LITRPPLSRLSLQYWGYVSLEQWNPISTRPQWRIFFNRGPGMTIHWNGTTYDPGVDGPVLITPDSPILTNLSQPVDHAYLHFIAEDHSLKPRQGVHLLPWDVVENEDWTALKQHSSLLGNWRCHALIARCLEVIPSDQWENLCSDPSIQRVLEYIEQNLQLPLNNTSLAKYLKMTPHTFIRRFTKATKTSPQKMIEAKRIEVACKALEHSEMSIDHISQVCGYLNRFYFSNRFKKVMNMSPGQYRKLCLDHDNP